ncbi:UPF0481 protein At3g47200-like [Impatiens glandulifera]|uniref:UPF0481 protein At3g47200-like n=1 Tax=Impatiens glandulifera TaxID=253017 RepID=UPI001FB17350|nr:UPF0481 protein At3g47200-like [Impatiens glandulifera]
MRPQTELFHDHVTINIDKKLSELPYGHQEPFIFKVFDRYRNQKDKAYEPELLVIGPYNRGKDILIHTIEDHKLRYLHLLLERRRESNAKRYVEAIREVEERARRCYATAFGLETDQFVELLILDGLFIVELCRKFSNRSLVDKYDVIFKMNWIHHVLWRDMMLFENQIPFFVVDKLFQMTKNNEESGDDNCLMKPSDRVEPKNVKHILGLIYHLTTRSISEKLSTERNHINEKARWELIDNTTELHKAGIQLITKPNCPSFNVIFSKGTLEIPPIIIEEKTEGFLRNLIAYEQCQEENSPRVITDFTTLLCCLIKSSNDVGLLRKYGILNNLIGDDESASRVISSLSSSVFVSHDGFCYKEVFIGVNNYYKKRRNEWVANLWKNYFKTPWTTISCFAALVLLLLTFGQTLAGLVPFLGLAHHPP